MHELRFGSAGARRKLFARGLFPTAFNGLKYRGSQLLQQASRGRSSQGCHYKSLSLPLVHIQRQEHLQFASVSTTNTGKSAHVHSPCATHDDTTTSHTLSDQIAVRLLRMYTVQGILQEPPAPSCCRGGQAVLNMPLRLPLSYLAYCNGISFMHRLSHPPSDHCVPHYPNQMPSCALPNSAGPHSKEVHFSPSLLVLHWFGMQCLSHSLAMRCQSLLSDFPHSCYCDNMACRYHSDSVITKARRFCGTEKGDLGALLPVICSIGVTLAPEPEEGCHLQAVAP